MRLWDASAGKALDVIVPPDGFQCAAVCNTRLGTACQESVGLSAGCFRELRDRVAADDRRADRVLALIPME